MTEAEWKICSDPIDLGRHLAWDNPSQIVLYSERKVTLLACEFCRRAAHRFTHEWSNKAVLCIERLADGNATKEEMEGVRKEIWETDLFDPTAEDDTDESFYKKPDSIAYMALKTLRCKGVTMGIICSISRDAASDQDQCLVIRDLIGNPFRPVIVDSAWLAWNSGTIAKLAQAIYTDRAFDRMPILADALEDAGCINQDILAHCRDGGEHWRGCWVIDLLLGKS